MHVIGITGNYSGENSAVSVTFRNVYGSNAIVYYMDTSGLARQLFLSSSGSSGADNVPTYSLIVAYHANTVQFSSNGFNWYDQMAIQNGGLIAVGYVTTGGTLSL